jgi:hypothetical protein
MLLSIIKGIFSLVGFVFMSIFKSLGWIGSLFIRAVNEITKEQKHSSQLKIIKERSRRQNKLNDEI